nr:uncharacterized protein LOC109399800 [Aedes albopictus]
MAAAKGENNTTGFDYQLETLVFCVNELLQKARIIRFNVGSAVNGIGVPANIRHAFDDVVLHAELDDGQKITNMIQVKHTGKMIDQAYLCDNQKTNVLKYFKSFMALKPYLLNELNELVIWTNMSIADNIKDWFEPYVPVHPERDILGASKILKFQRYQLKVDKFREISRDFLDILHPRTALVEQFIDVLFKQEEWRSNGAAEKHHSVMAREVIECNNGGKATFKQNFMDGQGLLPETVLFRERFEMSMRKKFTQKNLGPFVMAELNELKYEDHFQLKVDAEFGSGKNAQWKWENVCTEADLEEFRKRFVFYVEIPREDEFKTMLIREITHFEELIDLLEQCAHKKIICDDKVKTITTLLRLRDYVNSGPYKNLKFDDLGNLKTVVRKYLDEWQPQSYLSVRGSQDVDCTLSRLISVVEYLLAPLSKRFLVLDFNNLKRNFGKVQQITSHKDITENGMKCLIITSVQNHRQEQEVKTQLHSIHLPIILVGPSLLNCFEDEFDVEQLDHLCRDNIFGRQIFLPQNQACTVGQIIPKDELFVKENFPLVLALHQKSISIESNVLKLDENYVARKISVNGSDISDIICDDQYPQIIFSDQAGMGKSTEMVKIAIDLRKCYQNHLVLYLDCKTAIKHAKCDIITAICKTINVKVSAEECLIKCLIRQKNVIMLLDGIDEVSESSRKALEEMLKNIEALNIYKVFIATRPHCLEFLEKIFQNSITCQLPPFSKEDQVDYLTRFWKIDSICDVHEHKRITELIDELIERFRRMLKDELLIGIPMQTYMIAVIYQESIRSSEFELPKPYTVGFIYNKFVDLKLLEVSSRQFDLNCQAHKNAIATIQQSFTPDHIEFSAKVYNSSESVPEELCNRLQTNGIVRLSPSIGFVHYTYYEYFITLYFLTYKTGASKAFISFMKQNLCTSRLSIATKFLDHHIDGINSTDQLRSFDNRTVDGISNDFEPPSTARLHPEKIREFNHYLEQVSNTERYTLIRNSLNLSVFNVFEVLYDSLPRDTKSSLQFCFGEKAEERFVNLKIMGGNQMVHFLSILLRKNPDTFIQQYLTIFDDEDEDYLEVACRKPFVQVLIWLVENLVPVTKDQNREKLYSYVNHRFDKYFQLVVQHNNALFLEETIRRAKDLWPKQTIYNFLIKRNVLKLFLSNVEIKSNNKPLKIKERIQMIDHIYELLRWASGGSVALSQDFTDSVDNLQNSGIQSAFRNRFQNQ